MLAGERFVAEFDLGNTPVAGLAEIMERELGILVLMVDAPMVCAPSSARCAASRRIFPPIGRPRADTLSGSRHANMKEMRFSAADGEWRLAFAFDPARNAVLLVAGDKSGGSARRFYRTLLRKADERFDGHLAWLAKEGES